MIKKTNIVFFISKMDKYRIYTCVLRKQLVLKMASNKMFRITVV